MGVSSRQRLCVAQFRAKYTSFHEGLSSVLRGFSCTNPLLIVVVVLIVESRKCPGPRWPLGANPPHTACPFSIEGTSSCDLPIPHLDRIIVPHQIGRPPILLFPLFVSFRFLHYGVPQQDSALTGDYYTSGTENFHYSVLHIWGCKVCSLLHQLFVTASIGAVIENRNPREPVPYTYGCSPRLRRQAYNAMANWSVIETRYPKEYGDMISLEMP